MSDDELLSVLLSGDGNEVRRCLSDRGPNAVIEGRPALLWVSSTTNHDAATTLLAMGADPNLRADSGETALLCAAYLGNAQFVQLLLQAGADVDTVDIDGQSALMAAAKGGHMEVVRLLVDAGASLDREDARGRTALHWSTVEGDNDDVVAYLLAKGAVKQSVSADGLSPRDYAIKLDRSKCLALL
jgi:uncharacterized protein